MPYQHRGEQRAAGDEHDALGALHHAAGDGEAEALGTRARVADHLEPPSAAITASSHERVVQVPGVAGEHEQLAPAIADRVEQRAGCGLLAGEAREAAVEDVEDAGERVEPDRARRGGRARPRQPVSAHSASEAAVIAFGETRPTSRRSIGRDQPDEEARPERAEQLVVLHRANCGRRAQSRTAPHRR